MASKLATTVKKPQKDQPARIEKQHWFHNATHPHLPQHTASHIHCVFLRI